MTVAALRSQSRSGDKPSVRLSSPTAVAALLPTLLSLLLMLATDSVHAQGHHQFIFSDAQAPFNPFTQPSRSQQQFLNLPYRQEPTGFRSSVGDLQTSDLPSHLQQTLPQYRFQNQPQHVVSFQDDTPNDHFGHFTFPNSEPAGFRTTHQFPKPTTMRPNYSHLFSKSRNRDPSQTETFLGQITLQSPPIEDPPQFEVFPEVAGNPYSDGVEGNSVGGRHSFLNHRTRFVAPDRPLKKPQVKDYFVDDDGEVYSTTKAPFVHRTTRPSLVSTTAERKHPFKPAPKPAKPPTTFNLEKERKGLQIKSAHQKAVDLEQLLEEPLKDNFGSSNDDEVEVIQSRNDSLERHGGGGDHRSPKVLAVPPTKVAPNTTQPSDPSTTYYDDSEEELSTHSPTVSEDYAEDELYETHEGEDLKNNNDNDIHGDDYNNQHPSQNEEAQQKQENIQPTLTTTPKPTTTNSKGKLYTSIDRTFRHPTTETTLQPTTTTTDESDPPTTLSLSVSSAASVSAKRGEQMIHKEPELVISVVTSKTVVNNTIVAPVTPMPTVTESVSKAVTTSPSTAVDNATEAWVVVASVQTSRSVSGARYLPSSIVEQDIRVKLLNEHATEDDDDDDEDHKDDKDHHHEDHDNNDEEEEDEDEEEEDEEEHTPTETTALPTTSKPRTSTESLIDKLDGLQSDLSSGVLTGGLGNNIAVIKETTLDTTPTTSTSTTANYPSTTSKPYPQVKIRKFSPANRPTTTKRPRPKPGEKKKPFDINQLQSDQPKKQVDISSILPPNYKLNASDDRSLRILQELVDRNLKNSKKTESSTTSTVEQTTENGLKITQEVDITKFLPPGYKLNKSELTTENILLKELKTEDISKFLPPGYKLPKEEETTPSTKSDKSTEASIFKNTKADDVSKFLPPGYKDRTTERSFLKNTKADDVSKFLPPGYKMPSKSEEKTTEASLFKNTKTDDLSKFLPPGYKGSTESSIFKNTKADDVSKFLPPGFKLPKYKENATPSSIYKNTKADDVAKFLPPGYKMPKTTPKPDSDDSPKEEAKVPPKAQPIDISALLPPGYNATALGSAPADLLPPGFKPSTEAASTTSKPSKVVFPTRPGGGVRKSATRTTPKSISNMEMQKPTPTIHKGWPSRPTTEFTGWPTPSTTPISVEKLLEAARAAQAAKSGPASTTTPIPSTTTPPTTTTTTTMRPTTPGVCVDECDLAGTIKMVDGVKWQPELLDRNTREWQVLSNEVQTQLDYVFSSSPELSKWYRKIRIDGFSEGSVLVDYLVELNDLGRRVDTQEIKQLFHESLDDALTAFGNSKRGGKSLNESVKLEGKLTLGNFVIDPFYTDFLVLPKQNYPTVGYADNDVLLPQWAIAVIVIGLASLLFVIIFGVTVLVNRQKNAKKKNPTPLTEDMLNELNKSHMGGFDNYGADDLYNMEDVWNDRGYEQKIPKKRSNGSIHDNSMSNLYDSWRSEWNGYYYNSYYGNNPGSSHAGSTSAMHYSGRRRSDYDTNF